MTAGDFRFRKDTKECIADVKFSPDNSMLAAGSHDNYIYVYSCAFDSDDSTSCVIRPLTRISGHSSFITHIGK